MTWVFEKHPLMGGATGQAFNNTLQGTMPPEDLLAREAIQNSCDASLNEAKPVKVVFRLMKIGSPGKKKILENMGAIEWFKPRLKTLGLQDENCLTQIKKAEIPLQLLYVEDYETCGIYGLPHSPESHFHRLLLALGDDSKAFTSDSTGGSYGYGKSVYTFNSKVHTIIAYSVFSDQGDGVTARLMGCSFFNRHNYDGVEYTGRAWLGNSKEDVVFPFENDKAHEIADKLGFRLRGSSQTGTTILIVDSSVNMDKLRRYIEDSWWPRLVDHALSVELYEDDVLLKHPRPKLREELKPFIECYEMSVERSKPTGDHQKSRRLNSYQEKQLGAYGFELIDTDKANHEDFQPFVNSVALIRNPRMVVKYEQFGRPTPPAVGVFVASSDVDAFLKLSEPPAHNEWDHTHSRLKRVGEIGQGCVKAIMERVRTQFRLFQGEAMPPQPTEGRRLKLLERMLGSIFRPALGKVPPPPHEFDPVSIHFLNKSPFLDVDGGHLVTRATFDISLREEFAEETANVNLQVKVPILEDENEGEGDPVLITLESDDHKMELVDVAVVPLQLTKGYPVKFNLRTEPYNPLWSTRVVVKVSRSMEA